MRARVEAVVCDLQDGEPAVGSITWKRGSTSTTNDLCEQHMVTLSSNGHAPTRGRPRGSAATPHRKKRQKRTTQKAAAEESS